MSNKRSIELQVLVKYLVQIRKTQNTNTIYNVKFAYLCANPLVLGEADSEKMKVLLEEIRGKSFTPNSKTKFKDDKITFSSNEIQNVFKKALRCEQTSQLLRDLCRKVVKEWKDPDGDSESEDMSCKNCRGKTEDAQGCESCNWWFCMKCVNSDPMLIEQLKNHEQMHKNLCGVEGTIKNLRTSFRRATQDFLIYESLLIKRDGHLKKQFQEKVKTLEKRIRQKNAQLLEKQQQLEEGASEDCQKYKEENQKLNNRLDVAAEMYKIELETARKRKREKCKELKEKAKMADRQVKRLQAENGTLDRRIATLRSQISEGQKLSGLRPPFAHRNKKQKV